MITREGFGQDDVPDLLYANFKEIDYISHIWSMNSPEMDDAVAPAGRRAEASSSPSSTRRSGRDSGRWC